MNRLLPALLALTLAPTAMAAPARGGDPPELAQIPPDAAVIVHARLADLWKSDGLADVRRIVLKAGPDALAALDRRFTPAPSTAEQVTAYIVPPAGEEDLLAVAFVTFGKPFDRAAVVKNSLPKARPMKGKLNAWYGDESADYGVLFVDTQTIAVGNFRGVARLADGRAAGPPVSATFPELADPTKLVTVAANLSAVPPRMMEDLSRDMPAELRPLLRAKAAVVSLDAGADGVNLRVAYPDKESADAAGKAIQDGVALAKGHIAEFREELKKKVEGDGKPAGLDALPDALLAVAGLGALQEAEDLLTGLPLKRDGNAFALAVPIPAQLRPLVLGSGLAAGMLVPATQRIRLASNRMKDSNNLKQFALAMHNYNDVNGQIPGAICDKAGKPLLSWRVMLLPYVEQDNLFRQFHLDEPWDSEHNKKLVEKMPRIFEVPGRPVKAGHTHYRTFVGEKGSWKKYDDTLTVAGIPDGTSNTWMIAEAEEAVIWTKPDELPADGKTPPKLGKFFSGGFNVAFWDGSVRYFAKMPKAALKFIDPNDGEVIGPDDDK
jgi:prepilin-type processing-associated H-X9-DG protein